MANRRSSRPPEGGVDKPLRIIGGNLRGRKLLYSGDLRTRPMKDRVRESVFDLLGPAIRDKLAIDLFAGTGALGLESLSRGAARTIFIEQHVPTAKIIEQNISALDQGTRSQVLMGSTFAWVRRLPWSDLKMQPWVVFCSPPYDFYVDRLPDMLGLLRGLREHAPVDSRMIVEADTRFDFQELASMGDWHVRVYAPAVIGIHVVPVRL
jgi:16S rRNA (guanine966-N2)-methyltransferase